MYIPRAKRKIMLLKARLYELANTGRTVAGGKVTIIHDDGSEFIFEKENGEYIPLVKVREIVGHSAEKGWKETKALPKYDEIVFALYPKTKAKSQTPVSDPKDKLAVFDFAEQIGFDRCLARYILDQEYARSLPTFTSFCQKNAAARTFTENYGGLYFLYRYDNNNETREKGYANGLLVRATVSIRYPVPYMFSRTGRKVNEGSLTRVRCKINIPGYDKSKEAPYKYDGYVTPKDRWWQWLLQARPNQLRSQGTDDLILMYTEQAESNKSLAVSKGIIVTQSQGQYYAPTVSRVVLIRHPSYSVQSIDLETKAGNGQKKKTASDEPLENLTSYYTTSDVSTKEPQPYDERSFMRGDLDVIDLESPNKLSEFDQRAIHELLFSDADRFTGLNLQL